MSTKQTNSSVSGDNSVPEQPTSQVINQPDTNKEPSKNSKRWKKVLIIGVVIILGITLSGYLLLSIVFSGGIDNVISNLIPAPDTNSRSFIDKKTQARDNIQKSFTKLESITGLKPYGSSSKDYCDVGQNNYKVSTGYAHQCVFRTSKFYGINDDFRQKMLDFEKQILSDNWKDTDSPGCTHCTISGVITNYYDDSERTQRNPKYLPPEPGIYTKEGYILDIMYGYKEVLQKDSFGYSTSVPDIHEQKEFQDGLVTTLNSNQIVFVVSIEQVFFKN